MKELFKLRFKFRNRLTKETRFLYLELIDKVEAGFITTEEAVSLYKEQLGIDNERTT